MLDSLPLLLISLLHLSWGISVSQVDPWKNNVVECGVQAIQPSSADPGADIVGGSPATPHSWPWAAQLKFQGSHFCGGSLIDPQWVVTSAHCMQEKWATLTKVHLGSHQKDTLDTGEVVSSVSLVISHQYYDDYFNTNDIALLKLSSAVTLTDYVDVICLAGSDYAVGTDGIVVGWGDTQATSDGTVLNEVTLPIIQTSVCNGTDMYDGWIFPGMFCAGFAAGGKDACQGDSGGPFQILNTNNAWDLYGVTSWGDGCAQADRPGVYTHVPTYVDWIYDTMQSN